MSNYKKVIFFFVISFVSLYLINFNISTLAQVETTFDTSTTSEAVTSVNDAILKSLVIISQVAVLGISFNCFFFNIFLNRKGGISNNNFYYSNQRNFYFNTGTVKRVTSIMILCCVSIIFFSTFIILLQSYQLSQNLTLDVYSAFKILFTTAVGQVWLLRVGTSSAIMALMIISYYLFRIREMTNQSNIDNLSKHIENKKNHFGNNRLYQIILIVVIIFSSINIFSNSMVSHSNSVSSLSTFAVSVDWIHYMAVSIWIGGLFYLSLFFLRNIKPIDYDDKSNITIAPSNVSNNITRIHNISISLMNFSFIVIIALCIIGISGLYLGYVHLQDLNSIFSTSYGQILILKLGLAFPLIFIGRYNQLKIFKYTLMISALLKHLHANENNTTYSYSQQDRKNRFVLYNALSRSLKIESVLGIAVLVVASFLSITSPPSLEAINVSSTGIQTSNVNESGNSYFFYLATSLAVIISVITIVNYRKNQKQIKRIAAILGVSPDKQD